VRVGANVIHLATMKTDVLARVAGSLYTLFEGLLDERSTDAYNRLDEAFVEALALEREIAGGVFAVMDGVVAGEGPCPRCPVPHTANVLLASADPVALDTVAANMMGIAPESVPYLRMAQERGLGTGELSGIEVVGDDVGDSALSFRIDDNSVGAHMRLREATRNGRPPSAFARLASFVYHDIYWFRAVREPVVREFRESGWGKLFESYRTQAGGE